LSTLDDDILPDDIDAGLDEEAEGLDWDDADPDDEDDDWSDE
jgi:hypothetical protein